MIRQGGGGSIGQSLQYIDPTAPERYGPAGGDLLGQQGLIVRPEISMKRGGGSVGQSLQYVDPTAPERSGPAGGDVLGRNGLIVRPEIPVLKGGKRTKGGFVPSCMAGVVGAGPYLGSLAALTAKRMLNRTKKGGGSKENWASRQSEAKSVYQKFCKPSATFVNRLASALKKGSSGSDDAANVLKAYEDSLMNKTHVEASKLIEKYQRKMNRSLKKKQKVPKQVLKTISFDTIKKPKADIWATLIQNAERKLKETAATRKLIKQYVSPEKITTLAGLLQTGKSTRKFLKDFEQSIPITIAPPKTVKKVKEAQKILETITTIKPVKAKLSEINFNKMEGRKTKKTGVAIQAASLLRTKPKTFSLNHKTAYTQAKKNLDTIRPKPHSSKIMKLVALRKKGEKKQINNFLKAYKTGH